MLVHTLRAFNAAEQLEGLVLVISDEDRPAFEACLASHFPRLSPTFVTGGAERQDSVRHGLDALDAATTEIVFIHDAARPFIQPATIRAVHDATLLHGAATVAIPAVDTILEADESGMLLRTPDRARLWQCQTPQTFRLEVIKAAHAWAQRENLRGTDDATLVRGMGHPVALVPGTRFNLKVTTPEDAALAELLIRENLACTA